MKAKRGDAWRNKNQRFVSGDQLKLATKYPKHAPVLTASRLHIYFDPGDRTPIASFAKTPSGWADGDLCFATAMDAADWAVETLVPVLRRRQHA